MRTNFPPALPAIVMAPLAALALLTPGCGGGGGHGTAKATDVFAGATASPRKAAPPLSLRDYRGSRVSLAQDRGKAVLVTFIYTHCPDVCPLIVGHLKAVRAALGPESRKLEIVAVSTDPRGDTPKSVTAFVGAHAMTGKMDYLIGSRRELLPVWKRWGIAAKPARVKKLKRVLKSGRVEAKSRRAEAALIEHTALVYGISASGKLTTLYPANFKPAEIVHDVPKLAAL